eukprot:7051197-Pyramimonas_sp.AAC.1
MPSRRLRLQQKCGSGWRGSSGWRGRSQLPAPVPLRFPAGASGGPRHAPAADSPYWPRRPLCPSAPEASAAVRRRSQS